MNGVNKKYSVLIIEDDPHNLKFLQTLLSRYFNITTCRTESEFFNLITTEKYDLLLMDISLSGEKSGIGLIKSLRKIPLYKNTPIIALSAHVAESDKYEALNAGANLYLRKPVQNRILIDSIFSLLERKGN
ncbi:MAG: response regulator [Ignavibacterium sp.]|jgi:DNA-binding response OmpR family regulator|uniref:response regulator n=1 Tax=Ignavibacterium album TaxID=591197 RepID=UPI0026EF3C58|nr:response regulator [Ignavibacterium album]MCA2004331.1 response regulator [Ignavibacterium sp.]MCX8105715.1 response regulator [Ignavibacterium album]